ncbi:MAG TPA: SLBB domain-containing protein [Gemmatimonadaceae bacterium]|nr:SLBB domain-containing protein [Gemmatimonadaceae bacterium]
MVFLVVVIAYILVRRILPFVVFLLVAGSMAARAQTPVPVHDMAGAPLRTGDIVRIKVWREPDLTGDATVTGDGDVAIPRLGTIRISTMAPDSLRRLIVNTYSAWLVNPTIEITFLRRLRVFGAVENPGVYPVDAGLTVADAIAMAGGVNENGSYNDVQLVRSDGRSRVHVTRVSRLADLDVQSGDEVYVPERSWMSRNSAAVVTSAITAIAIVFGALIRP